MYSITNLCFLCLSRTESIKSVLSCDDDSITIVEKLECILTELISFKPEIPKYICVDCLKGLNYVYKFKQKCLENLTTLSAYLEKISAVTTVQTEEGTIKEDNAIEVVVKIEPNDIQLSDEDFPATIPEEIPNPRQYKCTECNKAFLTASHLKTHFRSHTGSRPYQCAICQKAFILLQHLKAHEKIHTGIKPFSCEVCSKTFAEKATLTVHKRIHDNVRPYHCPQCNKSFTVASNLSRHLRIHTGVRPYQCDVCLRRFTQIDVLKNHARTHTGLRPFLCGFCPKAYTTQGERAKHRKKEHNNEEINQDGKKTEFKHFLENLPDPKANTSETSEDLKSGKVSFADETDDSLESDDVEDPPFSSAAAAAAPVGPARHQCPECHKVFSAQRALRTHARIHTGARPYECPTCGKAFVQLQHLRTHERSHSGVKPYECDVCGKRFFTMGHVTTHKRIHDNVKPYQCDLCEKSFSEAGNLGRHMRVHNAQKC